MDAETERDKLFTEIRTVTVQLKIAFFNIYLFVTFLR